MKTVAVLPLLPTAGLVRVRLATPGVSGTDTTVPTLVILALTRSGRALKSIVNCRVSPERLVRVLVTVALQLRERARAVHTRPRAGAVHTWPGRGEGGMKRGW